MTEVNNKFKSHQEKDENIRLMQNTLSLLSFLDNPVSEGPYIKRFCLHQHIVKT